MRTISSILHSVLLTVALAATLPAFAADSLDGKTIDRVVHAQMDQIQACYDEGLKRLPRLRGKLVAKLKVERDGSVHEAGLVKSTLRDEQVEHCLVGVFETMQFPAFGPPCADGEDCSTQITYPLTFTPG